MDCFCLVSGAPHLPNPRIYCEEIHELYDFWDQDEEKTSAFPYPVPEDVLVETLAFTQDDVDASQDLVLLAPVDESGKIDREWNARPPKKVNPKTVKAIYNCRPVNLPHPNGQYRLDTATYPHGNGLVTIRPNSNRFFVFLAVYRVIRGYFPQIQPHHLYTLGVKGKIDTSPCNRMHGSYGTDWLAIAKEFADADVIGIIGGFYSLGRHPEVNLSGPALQWLTHFYRVYNDLSVGEVIASIWRGRGNLYSMVRPDRFPISKIQFQMTMSPPTVPSQTIAPFETLPVDIVEYICVEYLRPFEITCMLSLSHFMRSRLWQVSDTWSLKALIRRRPYYLPVAAVDCIRGNEEMERWREEWAKRGFEFEGNDFFSMGIPWGAYARGCTWDSSMMNRKRIWKIGREIVKTATKMGILGE